MREDQSEMIDVYSEVIDLFIVRNPEIIWLDDDHNEYVVAAVLGDIPLILLDPIPKEEFWRVEATFETLVEHETIEHLLRREEIITEDMIHKCSLKNIHDLNGWKV